MCVVLVMLLLGGVFAAPFLIPEHAKRFIRQKRLVNYWDPSNSQNVWGYTVQEQVNEYWTALRTDIQYYMDMGNLVFDPAVVAETMFRFQSHPVLKEFLPRGHKSVKSIAASAV